MPQRYIFLCLLSLIIAASGSDQGRTLVRRSHRLNGWKQTETTTSFLNEIIKVRIALKQRNLEKLEDLVLEVSDPKTDMYGKYLSVVDVTRLVSPTDSHINDVMSWLKQYPAAKAELTVNKDYVNLEAPVSVIQDIFSTQIHTFSNSRSKSLIYRSHSYSLPNNLLHVIEGVHGLINFPPVVNRLAKQGDFPGIDITPQIIKTRYNILNTVSKTPSNSQAVAEFEQAYFYPSDIGVFQKTFNLPIQNLTRLIGPNHPEEGYLGEASLDIEYIMATASLVDTWVFSMPGTGFDLIGWATLVLSTEDAPKVHSVSWGSGESGFEPDEIARTNVEFQKLAAAGFSVLVASGDDGTGSTGWLFCQHFDATWPATSPWVTSVGATYIDGTSNKEIAVSFSGGGFSSVNVQPAYQKSKVANYLQNAQSSLPSTDYYNISGRAIPDIAAVGTNFQIIVQNFQGALSGTSASTPVFSGIISLLNDVQAQRGLPNLGFLNPWLYTMDVVGFDITEGNNKVSNCATGFPAWQGYDCISGLGTPDLTYLVKNLPSKGI